MLAIRMQRTGRKGHANFRVVVQDVRQTPLSGKVIANLGTYDPHSKQAVLNIDKAKFYIKNGAQPTTRVASLLKKQGVKMPDWIETTPKKQKPIRNIDKLRKNRPADLVEANEKTAAPEKTEEPIAEEEPAEPKAEDKTVESANSV